MVPAESASETAPASVARTQRDLVYRLRVCSVSGLLGRTGGGPPSWWRSAGANAGAWSSVIQPPPLTVAPLPYPALAPVWAATRRDSAGLARIRQALLRPGKKKFALAVSKRRSRRAFTDARCPAMAPPPMLRPGEMARFSTFGRFEADLGPIISVNSPVLATKISPDRRLEQGHSWVSPLPYWTPTMPISTRPPLQTTVSKHLVQL
jgi:hypothetical protein